MLGSPRFDFLGSLFFLVLVAMMLFGGSPTFPPEPAPPQGKAQPAGQKPDSLPESPPAVTTNIPQKPGTKSTENVPPPAPGEAPTQTVVHTVNRGESLPSLARHYLPQSTYMTTAELEAAIRQERRQDRKVPSARRRTDHPRRSHNAARRASGSRRQGFRDARYLPYCIHGRQ